MKLIIIFPSFKKYPERFKLYCRMAENVDEVYIITRKLPEENNDCFSNKANIILVENKIKFYFGMKAIIKRIIKDNTDIIIINHFINTVFFFKRYKIAKRIKIITKFYSPNLIIFRKNKTSFNFRQKVYLLKRSFFDLISILISDVIIGNSKEIENLVSQVISKLKIKRFVYTLSTPVDTDLFHYMKIKKDKNCFELLFVGNLLERKGIVDLMEISYILKKAKVKFKLFLVGSFRNKKTRKEVSKLINKYSLRDNIKFTGVLAQKDLVTYYNRSDLFLFPSYYEGSPRAVKEAMSCGLPVISYELEGIKIIDKRKNIIQMVKAGEIKDFVKKIVELMKDKNKQKELSIKSRKQMEKFFSIDVVAKEELRLYYNLQRSDVIKKIK